jgi:hypothetical protein
MTPSTIPMLIDNSGQLEASETVRFGVDGRVYEIDLPARHASELRSMIGRYIRAARQMPSAPSPGQQPRLSSRMDQEQSRRIRSRTMQRGLLTATEADVRGEEHGLTDREKQELRSIVDAAKPLQHIVASRLRTKGLADRDTAGNWWLTDAGRRELMSA